jgi:glutamate-1-semialdehyde aminotransferase
MEVLAPPGAQSRPYVPHHGTWNGIPLAAAAGVSMLSHIRDGELIKLATQQADKLRETLNDVFERLGIPGLAYGTSSIWKTFIGEPPRMLLGDFSNCREDSAMLRRGWAALAAPMRQSMILEGVDTMNTGGFMSAVHDDDDIARTGQAFERSLLRLQASGLLARR